VAEAVVAEALREDVVAEAVEAVGPKEEVEAATPTLEAVHLLANSVPLHSMRTEFDTLIYEDVDMSLTSGMRRHAVGIRWQTLRSRRRRVRARERVRAINRPTLRRVSQEPKPRGKEQRRRMPTLPICSSNSTIPFQQC